MIPKKIGYVWFDKRELDDIEKKYPTSRKQVLSEDEWAFVKKIPPSNNPKA